MKTLIVSFILCLFVTNSFAAIYQTLDENGKIVFTDKPQPGSTEKKLVAPSIIKIKKVEEKKPVGGLGELKVNVKKKKAVPYSKFTIVSPLHDVAVRNNMGTMELKLKVTPELQTKFGHRIKVKLDGQTHKSSWKSLSISFKNVDRGTHTFQAFIVDESGKHLKSSKSVTFHLQRFSRLFK